MWRCLLTWWLSGMMWLWSDGMAADVDPESWRGRVNQFRLKFLLLCCNYCVSFCYLLVARCDYCSINWSEGPVVVTAAGAAAAGGCDLAVAEAEDKDLLWRQQLGMALWVSFGMEWWLCNFWVNSCILTYKKRGGKYIYIYVNGVEIII